MPISTMSRKRKAIRVRVTMQLDTTLYISPDAEVTPNMACDYLQAQVPGVITHVDKIEVLKTSVFPGNKTVDAREDDDDDDDDDYMEEDAEDSDDW